MIFSEAEILIRLNEAANNAGVILTYTHKLFFMRLLKYTIDNGCENYTVTFSLTNLSKTLNMPTRTLVQCLSRLTACGAIIREPASELFFPNKPYYKAYTTTINKKFIIGE